MRTIKFRGFNAKNSKWLYGSHIINRGKHFVAPDEFADDKTWEDYEVEPETIGQFTGLTDKKGNEIYEGDIVLYNGNKRVVEHEECTFGLSHHENGFPFEPFCKLPIPLRKCVVVGNIHDNPELMKGGEQ